MTLGVGNPDRDYLQPQHALEGRALASSLSGEYGGDHSFEVTRTIDPSDGANYTGGSNYERGIPLVASSSGLAGALGAGKTKKNAPKVREVRAGSLSYEEAMDWVPSPMTAALSALEAGPTPGAQEAESESSFGKTAALLLGGAALLWFFNR